MKTKVVRLKHSEIMYLLQNANLDSEKGEVIRLKLSTAASTPLKKSKNN